jgi:hypothetical protein
LKNQAHKTTKNSENTTNVTKTFIKVTLNHVQLEGKVVEEHQAGEHGVPLCSTSVVRVVQESYKSVTTVLQECVVLQERCDVVRGRYIEK